MRARFLAPALVFLALPLLTCDATRGQDKAPPAAPGGPKDVLPFGPGLLLPSDSGLPRKIEAVRDFVARRQWDQAARLIDDLLDRPEDVFLPVTRRGPDGNEITGAVSLRAETERLLTSLPRPGLDAYQALVGKRAAEALAAAAGQPSALAAVVRRYPHTRAGRDAAALLGAQHLDRGRFDLAAAYLERAVRSDDKPDPLTLFQAALALRRAGDREHAEQLWKRLAAAVDEITVGGHAVPLGALEKEFNRPVAAAREVPAEALLPDADWRLEPRSPAPAPLIVPLAGALAVAPAGAPLGPLMHTVVAAKLAEPNALVVPRSPTPGGVWLAEAVRRMEAASQPVLPAATPLVVGDKIVSRTLRGIRAVDLASGRGVWESPSPLALDALARDPAAHGHVGLWVEQYLESHPGTLLENSVVGTLSTDGGRVYAVDDLPVPPRPLNYASFHSNLGQGLVLADAPELTEAVYHSKLLAIDADSGKVVWELGGPHSPVGLRGCYFLGPPLPLGGKLYVPVEVGFDLRLLCLEPPTGHVVWSQTLATFKSRLVIDGGRRLHAVRLAYGDGFLVCPTQAGGVVAFDLVGRTLAWAQAYRDEPAPEPVPQYFGRGRRPRGRFVTEPPNLAMEWKVSAPVIAGGKVVFAAPDAPEMYCLDLRDGSVVWQAKRGEGDLFLAGASGDRVVVVGKGEVRALALADGKPVWRCETPMPAGRGAINQGVYRLPTRGLGKAEVVNIDLATGKVSSRTALTGKDSSGGAGAEPVRPKPPTEQIAALVSQLGSERSAAREAASQALEAAGPRALDALRKAVAAADPEVRRRAAPLARAIEKREETARLTEPQTLRLQYKGAALADAVADFSKRCGMTLKVPPEVLKDADRKITLDTGTVTFWQALDQFCDKAGLAEQPPIPEPAAPGGSGSSITIMGGRGGVVSPTDILRTPTAEKPPELVLIDAKGTKPRPSCDVGALRVRPALLEATTQQKKDDGEISFALDVASAGRLQWLKAVGLRLDRAIDEDGRTLSQLPSSFKPAMSPATVRGNVMINGMPIVPPSDEPEGSAGRLVSVRLKRSGEASPKKLNELSGTIVAQVRRPHGPLVTVENVLKSVGRTFKGELGGEVKVVEVGKEEDGQIRLKVRVERVGRGTAEIPVNPFGGTVIVNGRRLGEEDLLSSLDFSLIDEKGKPFETVKAVATGVRAGAGHEYELVYEPRSGQGVAQTFVYSDRRTLYIEVPFTLKDVPLP
jgi:outer membrane protein assembly factor BamB